MSHALKLSRSCRKFDVFEYRAYSDPKLYFLESVKEKIQQRINKFDKDRKPMSGGFNSHSSEMDQ